MRVFKFILYFILTVFQPNIILGQDGKVLVIGKGYDIIQLSGNYVIQYKDSAFKYTNTDSACKVFNILYSFYKKSNLSAPSVLSIVMYEPKWSGIRSVLIPLGSYDTEKSLYTYFYSNKKNKLCKRRIRVRNLYFPR